MGQDLIGKYFIWWSFESSNFYILEVYWPLLGHIENKIEKKRNILESLIQPKSCLRVFPVASFSKESACNARDPSLIFGLGRSLGVEVATHSTIPAWESLAGYSSWGRKESDMMVRLALSLSNPVWVFYD